MASARQQILQDRRSSGYSTGTRLRVLAPAQTGLSSIAKQSAANETDIMISKYNAGLIGNEEMKSFLQNQLNNQYVSASDKTQIQTKLLDFDNLIAKDRLEAAFKSAQENTSQKEQAAKALAQYYKDRASTMVAGTPAHSQALENAGAWEAKVVDIQQSVNRQYRKNLENKWLQEVNQKKTESSERYAEASKMYESLYNAAMQQGDEVDAQGYLAKLEQAQTLKNQAVLKEIESAGKADKKLVMSSINQAKNDYHDGKIDAATYYKILSDADNYAVENGDAVLQNTINSHADALAKIEAKGGPQRATAGGMSVVVKSTASGKPVTNFDQEMYKNSEQMKTVADDFRKDGNIEKYKYMLTRLTQDKNDILSQQIDEWKAIASENSNAKVPLNGSMTDVSSALTKLYKEQADTSATVSLINSGKMALLQVDPDETDTGVNSLPTIKIVSKTNMLKDTANYVADESGTTFYKVQQDLTPIEDLPGMTVEKMRAAAGSNFFVDDDKTQYDVVKKNGKIFLRNPDIRYVQHIDPKTNEMIKEPVGENGMVRSYSKILADDQNKAIEAAKANELQQKVQSGEVGINEINPLGKRIMDVTGSGPLKPQYDSLTGLPTGGIPQTKQPEVKQQPIQQQINAPVLDKQVGIGITQPQPKPLIDTKPAVNIGSSMPGLSIPQPKPLVYGPPAPTTMPKFDLGTSITKMETPQIKPAAPAPQPNLLQQAGNAVSNLATSIKDKASSLFGKLKFW